jgi:hypothetical protein
LSVGEAVDIAKKERSCIPNNLHVRGKSV